MTFVGENPRAYDTDPISEIQPIGDAESFARAATCNGTRCDESYLGYKDQPDVVDRFQEAWWKFQDQNPNGEEDGSLRQQSRDAGAIILLNGFPGVGEFSIGRKLFDLFDHKHTRFIDNHLLIDPVQAIIPGRGTDHKALRHAFRRVAFDALSAIEDGSTTLILTSCLSSTEGDQQILEELKAIAAQRRISFFLFNISCDKKEHHSRLITTERSTGSKTKLVIPEVLDDILSQHKLVEIGNEQICPPQIPSWYMFDLDTTCNSIDESAARVHGIITTCMTSDTRDEYNTVSDQTSSSQKWLSV